MSRACLALFLSLVAARPAAAQVTRVSVSTAGVEANAPSVEPSISRTGRFVAFSSAASNLVAGDTNGARDVFVRDRDVDGDGVFDEVGAVATTRVSVATGGAQADGESYTPVITPDGRYIVFVSRATNLVPAAGAQPQLYRVDRLTGAIVLVTATASGAGAAAEPTWPAVSDDGNIVAFVSTGESGLVSTASAGTHLFVRNIAGASTGIAPEHGLWLAAPTEDRAAVRVTLSGDGTRVAYLAIIRGPGTAPPIQISIVADLTTNRLLPVRFGANPFVLSLSASGRSVVFNDENLQVRRVIDTGATARPLPFTAGLLAYPIVSPSARFSLQGNATLHDFDLGVSTALGFVAEEARFSADDRWLAIASTSTTLVGGDANGVSDVFVVDLADILDADNDGMDDRWETIFNLTDPNADPDGDGQTNAQEEDAGTHPNGRVRRFLAEGATGAFFHTVIALANPGSGQAAAVLTFDRGDGTRVRRTVGIPALRSTVVDVGAVAGMESSDVSTTIESDVLLGVQRSMTWGSSSTTIYGSHAETAAPSPSPTWFLAEGSTVLGFELFYLLHNPQATATPATVRYLLPSGTTITRTYDLPPGSRTTIAVNQIAGLEETDVSGDISADAPIVVERAMYRSAPGQPFALGTDSLGVPAAAPSWFFAEGATGSFFDLYVLVANPGATDATVQALYAKPDGTTVTRSYTVRPHSRFSVYVDAIAGLENTAVATTLTANVPIVAERAMYWPGGFFDYYEGHTSAGSPTTALQWVVAGAESGGPDQAQTFVLIANTENRAGFAEITLLPDAASTAPPPPPFQPVLSLPPNSRTTVPVAVAGSYGVRVTSMATGSPAVQLVVESAVYRSSDGVVWSAGSNALATPVLP